LSFADVSSQMPELPDVAVFERYLDSTSLHQEIDSVNVTDRDVLQDVSARRLSSAVASRQFTSTLRHGKHLFVKLGGGGLWLELHFGMTGEPKYCKSEDEPPEYARVILHFANGFQLAYVTRRKLGHVSLVGAPDELIAELDLGPDALRDGCRFEVFRKALGGGRGTIKSALMAQDKLAGIGNVYSDEILYHAHIHPKTPVARLNDKDVGKLHRSMIKVLETAIERKADVRQMPRTWLLPHRKEGRPCPRCGAKLKTLKVSGRTAYVCDGCQQLKAS